LRPEAVNTEIYRDDVKYCLFAFLFHINHIP
jgi:hypothetical protein